MESDNDTTVPAIVNDWMNVLMSEWMNDYNPPDQSKSHRIQKRKTNTNAEQHTPIRERSHSQVK